MADGVVLPGTGETVATEDRGTEGEWQKVLMEPVNDRGVDAFGRLRVSQPAAIFDSKLLAGNNDPLLWDESLVSGSGISASTPTANKPYIDFTSTLNTAGKFVRQTFRRFHYQPGKSHLVTMTGVLDLSGGGTGVNRCIGYFDDDNGVFFADNAGVIGVTIRTKDSGSVVDNTTVQSSWNIDVMDGTGRSGITVDWTKGQIFVIDFQWLSVGRIRFGLDIGGDIHYVHADNHANVTAIPWASTPNLPLRYEINTVNPSAVSTMRCICSSIISEGGTDAPGVPSSEATVAHVDANVADTIYAVVGIRLKTTALGCQIDVKRISMLAETSDDFEWLLIMNPTIAGTFTYSDKTNSCVQSALGATANTVTNGHIIEREFGSTTASASAELEDSEVALGSAIDGTRDEVVLCVRPLGANADIQGAMNWRELF